MLTTHMWACVGAGSPARCLAEHRWAVRKTHRKSNASRVICGRQPKSRSRLQAQSLLLVCSAAALNRLAVLVSPNRCASAHHNCSHVWVLPLLLPQAAAAAYQYQGPEVYGKPWKAPCATQQHTLTQCQHQTQSVLRRTRSPPNTPACSCGDTAPRIPMLLQPPTLPPALKSARLLRNLLSQGPHKSIDQYCPSVMQRTSHRITLLLLCTFSLGGSVTGLLSSILCRHQRCSCAHTSGGLPGGACRWTATAQKGQTH